MGGWFEIQTQAFIFPTKLINTMLSCFLWDSKVGSINSRPEGILQHAQHPAGLESHLEKKKMSEWMKNKYITDVEGRNSCPF